MAKKTFIVGAVHCPKTNKPYGVVLNASRTSLVATNSFIINDEKKFAYTRFPRRLKYLYEYEGCPYCHQFEDLYELTKPVEKKELKIAVSTPSFDNIGKILKSMEIKYDNYTDSNSLKGYDLLFINCGTSDEISRNDLISFVENGGCVYASDWASKFIEDAFPNKLSVDGNTEERVMSAIVLDDEVREIIGDTIDIEFDLGYWKQIINHDGEVILMENSSIMRPLPVMIKFKYGKGTVFYTSFHNYAQANEKEKALLQLLVLKQLAAKNNTSMRQAGKDIGFDVDELKKRIG
ncbi:MAG: hypothetical protein K5925_01455 [Bacilli bacterium]|nr:hypothetical protein [Bacilli bacterium]